MSAKKPLLDLDDLRSRYDAGDSVFAIAADLGVTRSRVVQSLKYLGLPVRSAKEAAAIKYARMTPQQRLDNAKAAHAAVRGKAQTFEHRCKIAESIESAARVNRLEQYVIDGMVAAGYTCTPQKAVGPYNVDVAINEFPIAVDVFGGNWHAGGRAADRFRKRTDYILNSDWHLIVVWVIPPTYPLTQGAIDQIVATLKERRRTKSNRRHEVVMYGTGKLLPTAYYDPNNGSTVRRFEGYNRSRGDNGRFSK